MSRIMASNRGPSAPDFGQMKRVLIAFGCAGLVMSAALAVSGHKSMLRAAAQQPQGGLIPITGLTTNSVEMDGGPHGANLYPIDGTGSIPIDSVEFPLDTLYVSLGLDTLNQSP